jgi:hypothetical protein
MSRFVRCSLLLVLALPVHAQPRYEVVDLSASLPANAGSQLLDLRDNGTASGMLLGSGSRWQPVVWRNDGSIETFEGGFYDQFFVRAGNGAGLLVGQLPGSSIGWARVGDTLQCIPTPLGCGAPALYLASIGNDVNETGVIDGQGTFTFQGLGQFEGEFNTAAHAIDNLGRIAGVATVDAANAQQQVLLWTGGGVLALGPPGRNRRPTAISDSGHIVGTERGPGGSAGFFGLRWHVDEPGQPGELLPALAGAISSIPNDVNEAGNVVGTAQFDGSPVGGRGWLLESGTLHDLDDLLPDASPWRVLAANAINADGDIAATARLATSAGTRAVLLRRLEHDGIFASNFAAP